MIPIHLKPHYDNTLITSFLQFFTLCFNHWKPQQLTASQYVRCLISMLTRERCQQRLIKNNQLWLWSNIMIVTLTSWKFYYSPSSYLKFLIHILEISYSPSWALNHTQYKLYLTSLCSIYWIYYKDVSATIFGSFISCFSEK